MKKKLNKTVVSIIAIGFILLWYHFAGGATQSLVQIADPTPRVKSATTTAPTENYFSAYFTNPPLDKNLDGIESNLVKLIDNAQTSVHGAVYEIDLENVIEALVNAKARGVEVQLVYDNERVTNEDREQALKTLQDAGIPMVPDQRSAYMHNKFFVIDDEFVWTGSFNISVNASHKNNENAVVFAVPEIAANYEQEFSEMFEGQAFGPKSPQNTPNSTFVVDGIEFENYFSPEDKVMSQVIAEIKNARNSIDFLSFSFTDVDLGYTMSELALNEDVVVRGVFDANQDMGDSVCPYLMERDKNIEGNGDIVVKLDGNSGIMHEKVIIIDNETVIFGSFNFSGQANKSNDENLLIIHDPNLAKLFTEEFQKVFDQAFTPLPGCKKSN